MEWRVKKESNNSNTMYLFIVGLFVVFVLSGGAWAEDPNDPNSCSSCRMDRPGDGPPPKGFSMLRKSTELSLMAAASSTINTKDL
jgi:hypothetical protein